MLKKLLLIDDDPLDRMLMKLALEKLSEDYDVIELDSAKTAIDMMKSERPVATLLDMRMPDIDGISLLKSVRETSELSAHPIFMVSGSAEPSDFALAFESGANQYFTKPSSLSGYQDLAKDILLHIVHGSKENPAEAGFELLD
jgi:CheY-like chemotaxis protein